MWQRGLERYDELKGIQWEWHRWKYGKNPLGPRGSRSESD
jgi:hypothetical protein